MTCAIATPAFLPSWPIQDTARWPQNQAMTARIKMTRGSQSMNYLLQLRLEHFAEPLQLGPEALELRREARVLHTGEVFEEIYELEEASQVGAKNLERCGHVGIIHTLFVYVKTAKWALIQHPFGSAVYFVIFEIIHDPGAHLADVVASTMRDLRRSVMTAGVADAGPLEPLLVFGLRAMAIEELDIAAALRARLSPDVWVQML